MENGTFAPELAVILPASTINIAAISPSQTQRLKTRIAASHGLVRVFIHPYYEKYTNSKDYRDRIIDNQYPKIDAIEKGLARILSLPPEKTPPVIIFEESNKLNETARTIADINQNSGNEVYLVPTRRGKSEPLFHGDDAECWNGWQKIFEYFKQWQVTKTLIGGCRLTISNSENFQILDDEGQSYRQQLGLLGEVHANSSILQCVGEAIRQLSKHFNIEVSSLTHPHSRIDISRLSMNNKIGRNTPSDEGKYL